MPACSVLLFAEFRRDWYFHGSNNLQNLSVSVTCCPEQVAETDLFCGCVWSCDSFTRRTQRSIEQLARMNEVIPRRLAQRFAVILLVD
jgi:hypothetical protein